MPRTYSKRRKHKGKTKQDSLRNGNWADTSLPACPEHLNKNINQVKPKPDKDLCGPIPARQKENETSTAECFSLIPRLAYVPRVTRGNVYKSKNQKKILIEKVKVVKQLRNDKIKKNQQLLLQKHNCASVLKLTENNSTSTSNEKNDNQKSALPTPNLKLKASILVRQKDGSMHIDTRDQILVKEARTRKDMISQLCVKRKQEKYQNALQDLERQTFDLEALKKPMLSYKYYYDAFLDNGPPRVLASRQLRLGCLKNKIESPSMTVRDHRRRILRHVGPDPDFPKDQIPTCKNAFGYYRSRDLSEIDLISMNQAKLEFFEALRLCEEETVEIVNDKAARDEEFKEIDEERIELQEGKHLCESLEIIQKYSYKDSKFGSLSVFSDKNWKEDLPEDIIHLADRVRVIYEKHGPGTPNNISPEKIIKQILPQVRPLIIPSIPWENLHPEFRVEEHHKRAIRENPNVQGRSCNRITNTGLTKDKKHPWANCFKFSLQERSVLQNEFNLNGFYKPTFGDDIPQYVHSGFNWLWEDTKGCHKEASYYFKHLHNVEQHAIFVAANQKYDNTMKHKEIGPSAKNPNARGWDTSITNEMLYRHYENTRLKFPYAKTFADQLDALNIANKLLLFNRNAIYDSRLADKIKRYHQTNIAEKFCDLIVEVRVDKDRGKGWGKEWRPSNKGYSNDYIGIDLEEEIQEEMTKAGTEPIRTEFYYKKFYCVSSCILGQVEGFFKMRLIDSFKKRCFLTLR